LNVSQSYITVLLHLQRKGGLPSELRSSWPSKARLFSNSIEISGYKCYMKNRNENLGRFPEVEAGHRKISIESEDMILRSKGVHGAKASNLRKKPEVDFVLGKKNVNLTDKEMQLGYERAPIAKDGSKLLF